MYKLGLKGNKFRLNSRKYSSYKGRTGTVAKNLINLRFHTNVCHQKLTTEVILPIALKKRKIFNYWRIVFLPMTAKKHPVDLFIDLSSVFI